MQIRSVGIDLGKTTFHLVALSAAGKVLLRKKFTQKQLITFTANMQSSLIGMEACSGAHFLGRVLQEQGHDVKLIPPRRSSLRRGSAGITTTMPPGASENR
jgi:transposase